MKAVAAHAALLVATLGAAWATWSREGRTPAAPGSVTLWEVDSTQVSALHYQARGRQVDIERRSDSAGTYLWGRVTPASVPDSAARPTEFVVGEVGHTLVRDFSSPSALRELGVVDADREKEYGLAADSAARLEVEAGGERHELRIGGSVFGSGDRYAQDPATRRVYVLPGGTLTPFESAEATLPERRLHTFTPDAISSVVVVAAGGRRPMRRIASAGAPDAWAPPNAPDRPDQTFANFMDRFGQLSVGTYAPEVDPAGLRELVRLEYRDARDRPIGWLALSRAPRETGDYYAISESSRVPVKVFAGFAEEIARDVEQLFAPAAQRPAG